jgi:hypothetical protein
MARRAPAAWLAVVLLAAFGPSAAAQSLPVPETPLVLGDDHTVLSVQVPLVAGAGSASTSLPIDGGLLEIQVDPILLPGPGGTVDVGAYLAQARLLLPSGVAVPLPSMVIHSEEKAIDGPAAQALAELAAAVADLRIALETLDDEPAEPAPEPEPEPESSEPDPVAEQIAALQAQAAALALEAAWVQAFADEAAAAAGAGVEEQAAIAAAMLARVEAGLVLLQKGLDALEAQASSLAPVPPALPSPSESEAPASSSSSSSSSVASSPPPSPEGPDASEELAAFEAMVAEAQTKVGKASAKADEARAALGEMGGNVLRKADEVLAQQEQAARDGARMALALAQQTLTDQEAGAKQTVADLQEALADQAQGPQDGADAAAADAQAALAQAAAQLQWASDWIAEAQGFGASLGGDSLADASRSTESARATVGSMLAIVERYRSSQSQPVSDDLASQLAPAGQALDEAAAQAASAEEDLEAALLALGSVPEGLEPLSEPSVPALPMPGLPSLPSMPIAVDPESKAVCLDSLAAQACFEYRSPIESGPSSLMVLVAVPVGLAGIEEALASLPDDPGDPGELPVDPAIVPAPPIPDVPGLPGLPGSSSSTSEDPSGSASESASASASPSSSVSQTAGLLSSSSSSSSSAAAPAPHLKVQAGEDALGLRMGEQAALVVKVRNDGTAADVVRLTAQTDAPIAFDATDESMELSPGEEGTFTVRITPLSAGSGTLELLATGEQAATAKDAVLIAVAAAPSPPSPAAIAASIDPTALNVDVGQAAALTLHLSNQGSLADRVSVSASGPGLKLEPGLLDVLLQPGESVARQVWVTPTKEGPAQVQLRITSDRGADLQPLVLLESIGIDDDADRDAEGPDVAEESKGSPGPGVLVLAMAVGLALLGSRRLRK